MGMEMGMAGWATTHPMRCTITVIHRDLDHNPEHNIHSSNVLFYNLCIVIFELK